MRRFVPLVAGTAKSFRPLISHDQAFDTLLLPAAGDIIWTASNRIVVEYTPIVPGYFALVAWPDTALPFYVRDNQTRYALNDDFDGAPVLWSVPYAGQVLTPQAVFEFWSSSASGTATLPDYSLTISSRTQICCDETAGTQFLGHQYSPYCQYYPVCFPICT